MQHLPRPRPQAPGLACRHRQPGLLEVEGWASPFLCLQPCLPTDCCRLQAVRRRLSQPSRPGACPAGSGRQSRTTGGWSWRLACHAWQVRRCDRGQNAPVPAAVASGMSRWAGRQADGQAWRQAGCFPVSQTARDQDCRMCSRRAAATRSCNKPVLQQHKRVPSSTAALPAVLQPPAWPSCSGPSCLMRQQICPP